MGAYCGDVQIDDQRPSPLRGLWSFTVGGLLLVVIMVTLDPVMRREDCPNYGGNGNASGFGHELWDVGLLLMSPAWILTTIAEQFMPVARRGAVDTVARAMVAISLTVVAACFVARTTVLCH